MFDGSTQLPSADGSLTPTDEAGSNSRDDFGKSWISSQFCREAAVPNVKSVWPDCCICMEVKWDR